MLILPIAVWGWRMLTHRTFDREALRLGCWILCTVIAAGFASCWPHSGAWPLPTGLGGVVGDALVRAPAVVFGPPGFLYRLVLGNHARRRDGRDIPDRVRLRLAPAGRGRDTDRGRRHAVRGRGRRRFGLAGMGVSCRDERQGAARLAACRGLSPAGLKRARKGRARFRASGAQSRRPFGAVAIARGRRGFRGRGRRRRGGSRARAPRKKAAAARAGAQILQQVRTAVGVGADPAQGIRSPAAQQIGTG